MTIKHAYHITRRFKSGIFHYSPFSIQYLLFKDYKNTVKVGSPIFDTTYKNITKKEFLKQKDLFNIQFKYSYDKYDEYQIDERVYLTSIGIVTEEDYFLAVDIMHGLKSIPKKDLKSDIKYISDKGKEYFFIKNDKGNLYDLKLKKHVLKDSIRIVDEIF